jgi:hypothetical protein
MKRRSAPLVARDTLALLTGGRTCTSSGVKHIDHQHHNDTDDTANPSTPTNDDIFDNIRQTTSTEQSYCITLDRTTVTKRPTNPIATNTTTEGADLAYLQQSHRYVNAESRKDSADRTQKDRGSDSKFSRGILRKGESCGCQLAHRKQRR